MQPEEGSLTLPSFRCNHCMALSTHSGPVALPRRAPRQEKMGLQAEGQTPPRGPGFVQKMSRFLEAVCQHASPSAITVSTGAGVAVPFTPFHPVPLPLSRDAV